MAATRPFGRRFDDPPSVALVRKALVVLAALLRATARGRPQWMRTPPPEVRELPVEIRHQSTTPGADTRL